MLTIPPDCLLLSYNVNFKTSTIIFNPVLSKIATSHMKARTPYVTVLRRRVMPINTELTGCCELFSLSDLTR